MLDWLLNSASGLCQWIVPMESANRERQWRALSSVPAVRYWLPDLFHWIATSVQSGKSICKHILSINRAVFWLYSSLEIRKSLSKNREMNATVLQSALQPLRQPASQAVRFANAPNRTVNRCEIKDLDFHFRSYSSSLEAFSKANLSVVLFFSFSFNFCKFLQPKATIQRIASLCYDMLESRLKLESGSLSGSHS